MCFSKHTLNIACEMRDGAIQDLNIGLEVHSLAGEPNVDFTAFDVEFQVVLCAGRPVAETELPEGFWSCIEHELRTLGNPISYGWPEEINSLAVIEYANL